VKIYPQSHGSEPVSVDASALARLLAGYAALTGAASDPLVTAARWTELVRVAVGARWMALLQSDRLDDLLAVAGPCPAHPADLARSDQIVFRSSSPPYPHFITSVGPTTLARAELDVVAEPHSAQRLLHTLHTAAQSVLSPSNAPTSHLASQLTESEQQTLRILVTGLSEKQTARILKKSQHTIHSHVKRIYKHLAVSSRAELLSRLLKP
jgi:DNA-binding CsgD family transcriptional regulator